jgi:hypothetical protein
MTLSFPFRWAQQNDVAGRFPLPFGLQTTYRILNNIYIHKAYFQVVLNIFLILASINLS